MRDGGKLAAAIEVLADIEAHRRPVRLALKAWGDRSRFAGAKDRAWVSGLVLDALRRKRSLAWRMGEEGPRALPWACSACRGPGRSSASPRRRGTSRTGRAR